MLFIISALVYTSVSDGQLFTTLSPSVITEAATIGRMAFLEVGTLTHPNKALPPLTVSLSKKTSPHLAYSMLWGDIVCKL